MLAKILIAIAAMVAVFAVVVLMQPSEFHISRSIAVAAPPEAVFAHVNEMRKWEAWSPWEKLDPDMKRAYEGPAAGVGASYAWAGDKNVGEGRSTIVESRPNELVRFKLEMFKPMSAVNDVAFTFKPEGGQTLVTWGMTGKSGFVARAVCLFMDMDKMVGGQFEKGLAGLRAVVEEKHDLTVTRVFDAPVERVWKAWSEPELVKRWWGPDKFTCPSARMDFREGGTSIVCMRAPKEFGGHDMYSAWEYRAIAPRERIEYIHNLVDKDGKRIDPASLGLPADFPPDVRNVIAFKDLGDGRTEVTVSEYGYPSEKWVNLSRTGLEQCLDKMAALFAKS